MERIEFSQEMPGNDLVISLIESRDYLAITGVIIGLLAISGYLIDIESIRRPIVMVPAIHPYTALFLISSGLGLYKTKIFSTSLIAIGALFIPALLSLINLFDLIFASTMLPNNILFPEILDKNEDLANPITISANTCLVFVLVFICSQLKKHPLCSQFSGLLAVITILVSNIGYVYGLENSYVDMSPLTTIGLLALALNSLFITAHRPVLRIILTTLHHAILARWLLFLFVFFAAFVGYLTPVMFGDYIPKYYSLFIGLIVLSGCISIAVPIYYFDVRDHERRISERNTLYLASHDNLTEVYNRNWLETITNRDLQLGKRENTSTSMLILDIDNFKQVNDSFGHQFGDKVLKTVGDCLIENTRQTDVVGRIGGEEFAILLPNTPLSSAENIANKIRLAIIETTRQLMQEKNQKPVTVSIGVSVVNHENETFDDLYRRADAGMYRAKKNGKNCIAVT